MIHFPEMPLSRQYNYLSEQISIDAFDQQSIDTFYKNPSAVVV